MTPQDVLLVRLSFDKVRPIAETAAKLFYDRLFAVAPPVRSMFPDDLTEQRRKLMAMLGAAIALLDDPAALDAALAGLGAKHASYGALPDHYPVVGETLLWTLEQGLGPDFTPDVRTAWTRLYEHVASVMMKAAAARAA